MKLPGSPSAPRPSYRDVLIIAILIVGVFCFALMPTLYVVFRALQWEKALQLVEAAFFPAFLLFGMAAWLVYRHRGARHAPGEDNPIRREHS